MAKPAKTARKATAPSKKPAKKAAPRGKASAKAAPAKKASPKSATKALAVKDDGLDPAVLARFLPWLRALKGYTRLHVSGLDTLPKGPCILAANHTGWLGLDYALAAISLHDGVGRTPRGLVHQAWFKTPATAAFARKVGLVKVSKDAMAQQLAAGHLVMVFPEGEKGAFRASSGYQVTEFARGFVRVAWQTGVPVVPVAILGGEESNPVDRTIDSYEQLLSLSIPVPRNLWPKPVKWRIEFLAPHFFEGRAPADADDHDLVHAESKLVRDQVQAALTRMQKERGNPYF